MLIRPLGTNLSEILIKIQNFSFTKMYLKMPSAKMAAILSKGRWVKQGHFYKFIAEPLLTPRRESFVVFEHFCLHWYLVMIKSLDVCYSTTGNIIWKPSLYFLHSSELLIKHDIKLFHGYIRNIAQYDMDSAYWMSIAKTVNWKDCKLYFRPHNRNP